MSRFRDAVGTLASRTEREITALYERHRRGAISRDQFVALAATVLARARAKGVAMADLSFTAAIIRAMGQRTAPLGLTPPPDDTERLRESVTTVLTQDIKTATTPEQVKESQVARLTRLARDTTAEAAVFGFIESARRREVQGGWTRETDVNPCPVCVGLADGVVRSWNVTMKRHTGCACVPSPSF